MSALLTQQLTFPLLDQTAVLISAVPDNPNAQAIITVENLGFYSGMSLVRVVDSVEYPIRGATNLSVSGASSLVFFDYEAPLDKSIFYRAIMDGEFTVQSAPLTITTDGRTFWLKDVILGAFSCKVNVEAMGDVNRPANVLGSFKILGRANPILVTDVRQGRTGSMQLTAFSTDDAGNLYDILASGNTLLFQAPAASGFPDMYFQAGDVSESWRGTMSNPIHTFTISYTETDPPSQTAFTLASNSWLLVAQFTSWQDVLDRREEWVDVLVTPYSDSDTTPLP